MIKTYEKSKQKRKVEDCISSLLPSGLDDTVLGLLGPNPEYPLLQVSYFAKKFISYEINKKVFNKQKELNINNIPGIEEVELHYGSILEATPTRFMDLDFCGSIITHHKIIKPLFLKQEQRFILDLAPKVFKFTVALRGLVYNNKGKDMINDFIKPFIESLLDTQIKVYNKGTLKNINNEYPVLVNSEIYKINMFSYRDGMPMLTILIQY